MITQPSIWGALTDSEVNGIFWGLVNNDVPIDGSSGTGATLAGPGCLLIDYTNKNIYINTNTKASPTWTKLVSLISTDTLTNKTLTSPIINNPTVVYNVGSFVAAGSSHSDGVAITTIAPGLVLVTGANAIKGAVLPAATVGASYQVFNDFAANAILKMYPADSDTIHGVSSGTAFSMAAKTSVIFSCVVAGDWVTIPLLPS